MGGIRIVIRNGTLGLVAVVALIGLTILSAKEPEGVTAFFTAATAIATGALLIAAWRALTQIDEARSSRHAVTATEFSRRWDEPDMIKTRALLAPYTDPERFKADFFNLHDKHPEDPTSLQMLKQADYLEDLAILEASGAVDYDFIKRSLGYIVVSRWDLWRDVADEYKRRNNTDNFPHFRELAARLKTEEGYA